MYSKAKKASFFIIAILMFISVSRCPSSTLQAKSQEKKQIKPARALPEKHRHASRAEQSACPLCNSRLLMEEGYREITTEEVKKLQKSDEPFILINTLPFYYYRKEHIPNSINIPLEEIEHIAPKLFKKDARIIVYCLGYHCQVSSDAAKKFVELGFTNVFDYKGGIGDWKEKGNRISGLLIAPGKK